MRLSALRLPALERGRPHMLAVGRHRAMQPRKVLPSLVNALNPWSWDIPSRVEAKFQILEQRVIDAADDDEQVVRKRRRATKRE